MGFSLRKFWKNWNDRYRYQQTPEGKAETKAKRDVAAAKAKERKDKREKQAREGIGYKKPYSAHSPSFSFTLECGHQILTSEWSGTGLLGKKFYARSAMSVELLRTDFQDVCETGSTELTHEGRGFQITPVQF